MWDDNLELRNRLLNLYKRLLLAIKSEDKIIDLYVEYIKIMLEYDDRLPNFKRFPEGQMFGNCYTYALDIKCPFMFQSLYTMRTLFNPYLGLNFNVGFISDINNRTKTSVYGVEELLDKFYADMDFLKIKVFNSRINAEPCHGGYKIFIFSDTIIKSTGDFHFVRRNADGTLSHRNGYGGNIKKIKSLRDVVKKYELVRTLEIVKPNFR